MKIVIKSLDNIRLGVDFSDYLVAMFDVEVGGISIDNNQLCISALDSGMRFVKSFNFVKYASDDANLPFLGVSKYDKIFEALTTFSRDTLPKTFVDDVLLWRKDRMRFQDDKTTAPFLPSWNRQQFVAQPISINIEE